MICEIGKEDLITVEEEVEQVDPEQWMKERIRYSAETIATQTNSKMRAEVMTNGPMKLTYEDFKEFLESSVKSGITFVEAEYWIDYQIDFVPKVVNDDFVDKAVTWFSTQVGIREDGKEFLFLKNIKIK